jgi:hypothetical protein
MSDLECQDDSSVIMGEVGSVSITDKPVDVILKVLARSLNVHCFRTSTKILLSLPNPFPSQERMLQSPELPKCLAISSPFQFM